MVRVFKCDNARIVIIRCFGHIWTYLNKAAMVYFG